VRFQAARRSAFRAIDSDAFATISMFQGDSNTLRFMMRKDITAVEGFEQVRLT
jgi:hypothetical protein